MHAIVHRTEILHPCLTDPRHSVPLHTATLNDRQRLGMLLEGCALDAHLGRLGDGQWASFEDARATARGRLVAVSTAASPAGATTPRDRCLRLLRRLFPGDPIPGPGEARRVARELARRWVLYLTPAGPDDLVADLVRAAEFLWHERFASYRESLGAFARHGAEERLSVAGPPAFRRRALRQARTLPELRALLRGDRFATLWRGETSQEVREPRAGAWARHRDRAARPAGLEAQTSSDLSRVADLHRRGQWRAVVREAARLRRAGAGGGQEQDLARFAIDAHLHLWRWRGAEQWAAFAVDSGAAAHAGVARLLTAWVAWSTSEASCANLAGAAAAPSARISSAVPLAAEGVIESIESLILRARLSTGAGTAAAAEPLALLLRDRSRRDAGERGRLWLELARSHRELSSPAAVERALGHAHRHLRGVDRPVELWSAAAGLVEARLRRGALDGLEDAIASLASEVRGGGDPHRELAASILAVRLDAARRRDDRAAAGARELLDRLPRGRRDRITGEIEVLRALAESRCHGAARPAWARRAARSPPSSPVGQGAVSPPGAPPIVGGSRLLLDALERIDRLARGEVPVLLRGETGTGKELAAKRLHAGSPRRDRGFLAVNCAALSESLLLSELFGHARGAFTGADRDHSGVFEAAHGGIVFLDEIGDLPLGAQGALLRVLQEGEVRRLGESRPRRVDVRVVAATHRDLAALVERGAFRQDLYYRLNVAAVRLPPLRERGHDVLLLARHFLSEHGGGLELAPDAEDLLLGCPWPGNVRELRSVVQVAAAVHDGDGVLEGRDLEVPPAARIKGSYRAALDAERRRLLGEALSASGGRRADAARRLGISPQAVSYLVRRLGLEGRASPRGGPG